MPDVMNPDIAMSSAGLPPSVPPRVSNPDIASEDPNIGGAPAGLSGAPPTAGGMVTAAAQPAAPTAPHESIARHVLDALGGSNPKDPMGWAKSAIAGTLAGAANVGTVPPGGGFLTGVSRGAAGEQAFERQKTLDAQAKQKEQFEQQEKQKADAKAQQELEIHMEDAKAQRAMWNAQTAGHIQTQQQNAARFPDLQKEDQLKVTELSNKIHESEQDQLSVLSAAGVDISKLEHVTSYDQLTADHAKQAGAGGIFAVPNGEEHKAGEDGAGAYMVPGDVWEKKITKPITITTGYEVDPKTGAAKPKTITAQEGTSVGTLLSIAKGAQADLATKQKQIYDQSKLAHEQASTQEEKAGAVEKVAEAGKANAEALKATNEAAQAGTLNAPGSEGLSGDAYLKSLPGPTQQLFQSVAEGRNTAFTIQNRKGELTPAGQAFIRAYPDFDIAKAKEYPKAVQEFTTGQTSKDIVSMGTAINHTRAAYDNTGPSSFIPGTAENKRYNQDISFISEELGKYLKGGVAAEAEVKEIQNGIKSSVPWLRKAALENAAHLIEGRRSELDQKWKNAQVRPSYQPPMPNMSKDAEANLAYLRSGGKTTNPEATSGIPAGSRPVVVNGKTIGYTADGKNMTPLG
jgi:hypothetical protein